MTLRAGRPIAIAANPDWECRSGPHLPPMNLKLSLRKPLFHLLLPILLVLCFVGFPPPFAPPLRTRPAQEQNEPVRREEEG